MSFPSYDERAERRKRWLFVLFGVSLGASVLVCAIVVLLVMSPPQQRRLLGPDADFMVGQVNEMIVDRLSVTATLPNSPQWSDDIVFLIKQPDQQYLAFLGIDPLSGCKINWNESAQTFRDNCSQTEYSINGHNMTAAETLSTRPANLIELAVAVDQRDVYVLDQLILNP